ncbi:MAG: hypothetical protein P1S60_10015 [Anaerolineae bacterium]|nr:hypothetical protein [Anaerolineae bacterium]
MAENQETAFRYTMTQIWKDMQKNQPDGSPIYAGVCEQTCHRYRVVKWRSLGYIRLIERELINAHIC